MQESMQRGEGMVEEPAEDGSWSAAWTVLSRVAGGALGVPMVAGFVLLGAVVVAGRELRHLMRGRTVRPPVEPLRSDPEQKRPAAAA